MGNIQDVTKIENTLARKMPLFLLLAVLGVVGGQKFTVMTTTSSLTVTWDASEDFTVRIHGSNMTTCQVERHQTSRRCAMDDVEPSTRHDIVVMADNGWTEYYRGIHYTKPLPPRGVKWVTSSRETVSVEWTRPDQVATVEGYIIVLVRAHTNLTEYQNVVRTRAQVIQRRIYLPSTYGIPYGTSFRLMLWSQFQTERSSPVAIDVHSAPRPVSKLWEVASERTNTSATLEWSPPDRGEATGYRIIIRIRQTSALQFLVQSELNVTVPGSPTKHMFLDLLPASTYDVSIWTLYHGVEANMDRTSTFFTSPSPVKDLTLSYWTTDTATFSWRHADPFLRVGFEYIVTALSGNHNRKERAYSSAMNLEVRSLRPGFLYDVAVRIRMTQYPNAISEPATIKAQIKPDPVRYIQFNNITSGTANVTWSTGYNRQDSFSVRYHGIYVKKGWSTPLTSREQYIILEDLFPGETYYVGVTALSGGEPSVETTGLVTIVPLPPKALAIRTDSITDKTALVDVLYNTSASASTEWRVEYGLWSSSRSNYVNVASAVSEVTLTHLLPGKKYTVMAYGRTTGGLQSYDTTTAITLTTRPVFRTRMTPRSTSRSLTITYNYSPQYFDGYVFTLYPGGDAVYKMRYDKGEVTFYNLIPGSLYTVVGQVSSDGTLSEGSNITALTNPEVYAECGKANQTSLELFLEAPYGLLDEYMIECNPGCSYSGTRVTEIQPGVTTVHTVTRLYRDTRYEYRVRSKRAAGKMRAESRIRAIFCRTSK